MSGEKCQCKTPQINHIDVKKIHGSTCVTCGKIILYPEPKMPDSKVEVKACPIKVVYERFKHMDKLLCDPLIRKQYNGENDPYHLTLFDLWDAIKEHQSRPIANNGVSFDSIVDKLTHLNGDHLMGLELNNIHIIANFITKLPTTAPRGGQ